MANNSSSEDRITSFLLRVNASMAVGERVEEGRSYFDFLGELAHFYSEVFVSVYRQWRAVSIDGFLRSGTIKLADNKFRVVGLAHFLGSPRDPGIILTCADLLLVSNSPTLQSAELRAGLSVKEHEGLSPFRGDRHMNNSFQMALDLGPEGMEWVFSARYSPGD